MAVAISSRSSDRTRRTMFSRATSNDRPRLTSRMTRPNSVEIGGRDSRTTSSMRLEERRAGPQRVGDQRDRVRQLLVERVQAARLAAAQPEAGEHEADESADQQHQRVAEGREHDRQHHARQRQAEGGAGPDHQVLAGLEAQVGAGDLARQVRAEVPLLDDLVQLVERLAGLERAGEATLAARGGGRRSVRLAGGVALAAGR